MSAEPRTGDFRLLLRWRGIQLRNVIDQQLRDAPWRTLAVLVLLILIWMTLYGLLMHVFGQIRGWGSGVGIVALRYLLVFFFLALAVMLSFSNALISFSTLYGVTEAGFLLCTPVRARAAVCVKWLEGMFLSSWSFLLLGVPLMLAVAKHTGVEWYYYPLFLAHFLGFIAIPACIGLLAAWAVAMWAPRRPLGTAIAIGVLVLLAGIYWLSNVSRAAVESELWLQQLFRHIGPIRQPLLPSTWTARGIVAAMERRVGDSVFYLLVVVGNAAFLSWLTVNLLARSWAEAYSRARQGRFHPVIHRGWFTAALCWLLFFYLPGRLRTVMLKDVRGLIRDAKQWSQMAIMFGLLVIYVLNLPRLPVELGSPHIKGLIAFLNLTTVSLFLATFTSRFVYPLLSLESQQLWLLELLPLRRTTLLLVKFLFALTVTLLAATAVMGLAVAVLDLPPVWAMVNLLICAAVCIGLSGLSIGLGARFPVLGQRNPARIASGFGGTFNLIASMLFVGIQMAGVAYIGAHSMSAIGPTFLSDATVTPHAWQTIGLLLGGAVAVAAGAIAVGARHFARLET